VTHDHVAPDGAVITARTARAEDVEQIRALALDNGLFAADEMDGFDEGLQGYLDGSAAGSTWLVAVGDVGRVEGAAFVAPEPFGDRVWNLYFLAVRPEGQRAGAGSLLVAHVEGQLRAAGEAEARVLVVETSSTEAYAGARAFYERRGFDREAVIREFYGPGDDKVVFWKSLVS